MHQGPCLPAVSLLSTITSCCESLTLSPWIRGRCGHYLSRPNDFKSNSFLLVAGVWLAAIIINFIPGLETIMSFVLYPLLFIVFCWNCFVAVLAERKRPSPAERKAAKDSAEKQLDSGVVDLER